MNNENDTVVGKRSWVSIDILIVAVLTAIGIATALVRIEMTSKTHDAALEAQRIALEEYKAHQAEELAEMRGEFNEMYRTLTDKFGEISGTLNDMLFESRVNNELSAMRMGDRWTAQMQEDLQNEWFEMISIIHPELRHSKLPDIREIQDRRLESWKVRPETNGH